MARIPLIVPRATVVPHDRELPIVTLGPLDEQELATHWPLDPTVTAFITTDVCRAIEKGSREFLDQSILHGRTHIWGIYAGGEQQLAGVGLAHQPSVDTYDIGHVLVNAAMRRRRVGVLAKLAAASWLFATSSEITNIQADTLEVNRPARLSLQRAGFVMMPNIEPIRYAYGGGVNTAKTTDWALFRPDAQWISHLGLGGLTQQDIHESQQRFAGALASVDITCG